MSQSIAILPERAVFEITGGDARTFLQGLVTANVADLKTGDATHAGLLTPQGKIMFDFFIFAQPDGFLVDCSLLQKDDIIKRLGFYKLRANVEILPCPELIVAVGTGNAPQGDFVSFPDPRFGDLGWRMICSKSQAAEFENVGSQKYHQQRIAAGIADTDGDIRNGKLFPHETNFDQLGGVDFKKGCYVGQEVVSRMHHRGTARSRVMPVTYQGDALEHGTEIRAGGKKIGHILSAINNQALALVRLDRAKSATESGNAIEAGGVVLTLEKPVWADFEM